MKKIACCLVLLIWLLPVIATAQETEIAVTPAIVDAPVEIGSSVRKTIQVTNGSSLALPVSVEVQAAVIDGEPLNDSDNTRYDVASWVDFDQDTYIFEAGETKKISFTITAPFTALAGGHYAQISVRGLTLEEESVTESAKSLVFPEVGIPLLITVPGEIIESFELEAERIVPSFVNRNSSVEATLNIKNTGTIHNIVSKKIIIQKNGETVNEYDLQPSVFLPKTKKNEVQQIQFTSYGKHEVYSQLNYGSRQKTFISEKQIVYVTPPLSQLALLAVTIWISIYMITHRRNIVSAIKVLFK